MEYREFLEEIVGIIWGGDAENISEGEEEYKSTYNGKLLDFVIGYATIIFKCKSS